MERNFETSTVQNSLDSISALLDWFWDLMRIEIRDTILSEPIIEEFRPIFSRDMNQMFDETLRQSGPFIELADQIMGLRNDFNIRMGTIESRMEAVQTDLRNQTARIDEFLQTTNVNITRTPAKISPAIIWNENENVGNYPRTLAELQSSKSSRINEILNDYDVPRNSFLGRSKAFKLARLEDFYTVRS